jgi:hypothetical protein
MKLLIASSFRNNQIDGFFILKYFKKLKPMVFKIQRIPQQQYVGCAKFSI